MLLGVYKNVSPANHRQPPDDCVIFQEPHETLDGIRSRNTATNQVQVLHT